MTRSMLDPRPNLVGHEGQARSHPGYLHENPVVLDPPAVREDIREEERRPYEIRYEAEYGAYWAYLKPTAPRHFTPELVSALRQGQMDVEARVREEVGCGRRDRLRYQVFASRIPGVFSLGGDLRLFRALIRAQNRDVLAAYARDCIDLVYTNAVNYRLPVTTISLVQGQALGGGFEAALAANVVVAERQSKLGLPEVMFNMFPGMGAFQLLTRRLTPCQAERFILSGRTYGAEELYDMGVVDILAEPGEGEEAVWSYIRSHHRQFNGHQAMRRAIQAAAPLDYDALLRVAEIWVDQALGLSDRDLEIVEYLIRAQERMNG